MTELLCLVSIVYFLVTQNIENLIWVEIVWLDAKNSSNTSEIKAISYQGSRDSSFLIVIVLVTDIDFKTVIFQLNVTVYDRTVP